MILPTAYFHTATAFDESASNNNKINRKNKNNKNKNKARKELEEAKENNDEDLKGKDAMKRDNVMSKMIATFHHFINMKK